ncbi:MAG: hypothetical protein SGARI_000836 [Bacillariaceae sp.]
MANRRGSATVSIAGSSLSGDDDPSMSSFGDQTFSPVEWTLPLVDKETTEPQSMEEEMKRLEVLNSYFVLDSQGEAEFDRITELAAKMFDVPICLISLVDLGRQWFLSKVGLDAAETPRKHAFCAHVILNKYKMLVIPDASKDFRFKDNPLVTDGLKIRFYSGAALVSKEGYKLGTLCIISPKVRPQGLSPKEQEMLHNMAGMVVSTMEARRNRLLKEEYETKFHQLARTFLDTTHHLEEAKDNIKRTLDNSSWGTTLDEFELLSSTSLILDMQSKLCSAAMRTTLQDIPMPSKNVDIDEDEGCLDDDLETAKISSTKATDVKQLFDNINMIISNFPRQDVVTVEIDKTVPKKIGCDDLLLFRAVLNLLTHCMGASPEGQACGIRMRRSKKDGEELLVQCRLGGGPISRAAAKELFDNRDSLLSPVQSIIRSMGGRYGMFEARWDAHSTKDPTQSIFWFQVPYDRLDRNEKFVRSLVKIHTRPDQAALDKVGAALDKVKMDPFQKQLLQNGCGRVPVQ